MKNNKKNLRNNKHYNRHLQSAWDDYGEENFEFEIIEECKKEQLGEREIYWLDKLNCHNKESGYNMTKATENGRPSNNEECIQTTLYIEKDLKDKMKAYCFAKNDTLSNLVNDLFYDFLEKNKKEIEKFYSVMS